MLRKFSLRQKNAFLIKKNVYFLKGHTPKIVTAHFSWRTICFTMPSRLLGAPTVLNQMSFIWNFVFVKFFSVSKKVYPRSSKKTFVFDLITEKKISPKFFVEYFYKNIHNMRIKMFYLNRGHTFVLCHLVFAWVNF